MRYPASYILVLGDTEANMLQRNGGLLPPPPSLAQHQQYQQKSLSPRQVKTAVRKARTGENSSGGA